MRTIIISLGGSTIVPQDIDIEFLKEFKKTIDSSKDRFVIVCGGGFTNKVYNRAAQEIAKISNEDLDWIGIRATKLNAELIRSVFAKDAYEEVIDDPEKPVKTNKRIIIAAGYKPGCSSDKDAVLLAKNFNANTIINMSNIDYDYDKDPNKHKDAKPIQHTTWNEFQKLVGTKWSPRLHSPFDPIASRLAKELSMKVIILKGNNNLRNLLQNRPYIGTTIE